MLSITDVTWIFWFEFEYRVRPTKRWCFIIRSVSNRAGRRLPEQHSENSTYCDARGTSLKNGHAKFQCFSIWWIGWTLYLFEDFWHFVGAAKVYIHKSISWLVSRTYGAFSALLSQILILNISYPIIVILYKFMSFLFMFHFWHFLMIKVTGWMSYLVNTGILFWKLSLTTFDVWP